MSAQSPARLGALYVDGGPSKNEFLMQTVADILNHPLVLRDAPEASALGAAYLAGLSLGVWPDLASIAALPRTGIKVTPRPLSSSRLLDVWRDAVTRSTQPGDSCKSE
jgi:glycerol kinase